MAGSVTALERLRDLTRGVFPTQLARAGLGPALSGSVARAAGSGTVLVDESAAGSRFDARVEAAAYFCCADALRELAPPIAVLMSVAGGSLLVSVEGGGRVPPGTEHLDDRVEPLGGRVAWSGADGRLRMSVEIPVEPGYASGPAHTAVSASGPNEALGT